MRVNMVDLAPEPGDAPRRMFHDDGRHYIELAGESGPVLRLRDLSEAEQLTYLQEFARQCLLLAGDIERAQAGES